MRSRAGRGRVRAVSNRPMEAARRRAAAALAAATTLLAPGAPALLPAVTLSALVALEAGADPGTAGTDETAAGAEPGAAAEAAAPGDAPCGADRALEIASRVQARYDAISDLSARFVQSTESVVLSGASLDDGSARSGDVVFAKPGRMRWDYRAPEPSLVVSDGRTLWIYDEAARQVTRMPVAEQYLAGAALQFLLGEGRIVDAFQVSAVRCSAEEVELDLLPRQPASYERLGLVADSASGLVTATVIVDLFGNRTRIRFEDVRVDRMPDTRIFRFEVPDGVEVIDLTPEGQPG